VLERIVFEIALRWHAWRAIRAMGRSDMKFLEGYRTYLSLVAASLAMWAPQFGFDFNEADAAQLETSVNMIVTQFLILSGMFFRKKAKPK
jgi:hypothetical protein